MNRRKFVRDSAIGALGLGVGKTAFAKSKTPPDYMPILNDKMAQGKYVSHYTEREITESVLLCDERGLLNPAAIGWARKPLIRANLAGHWPRKKRWNFWNWISPGFVFSVTVADIDLAAFSAAFLIDLKTNESVDVISAVRSGALEMPEEVEKSIKFSSRAIKYEMIYSEDSIKVKFDCPNFKGHEAHAEFVIHRPKNHETLNIVVPWSSERFQMNSKHNTLPTEGFVKIGAKRYEMNPEECHAVHDFGRGMWPYRSYWNWGVCTGKQGDDLIGVNVGAKWTTGTGTNENAICYNGRIFKIMEDLVWEYDRSDWMKPWRIRADYSGMVDLTLTPIYAKPNKISLGVLSTKGVCSFGRWNGTLNFDGKTVAIHDMMGWAEEFSHRW